MTNKNQTKSFQKYAKAIGVDITENDLSLLNIAYTGYSEQLKPNYCYEIVNNEIVYKNINTDFVYEIHPNYKTFRRLVSDYKEKQLNKIRETSKVDKNPILESDTQSQIDEIEKNFQKLELEYETEVELMEHHVKKVCGKFLNEENLLKLSELTQKFEEIDKCKRECKSLYKICQVEIEKLCDQMMKLERLDNENTSNNDDEKNRLSRPNQYQIGSDSEDEDDINLKIKCFNEQELDEFHEEILHSYLSLKSIRK